MAELKVESPEEGEKVKQYTPEIRNAILRLLSSKKGSQINSIEGRDHLAEEVAEAVNTIIEPPAPAKKGKKGAETKSEHSSEGPVTAVLFSSFIIQ